MDNRELSSPIEVIYEDDDVLVVNKPAGLPMHVNLDRQRMNLVDALSRQLAQRDGTSGYLGIHQRLDVGTSGLVLFTRSKRANAGIAQQFETRTVEKRYLAMCSGTKVLSGSWVVEQALGEPVRRGGPVAVTGPGRKAAATRFWMLRKNNYCYLVGAQLLSGRKHQIRAHLAWQGTPIIGDVTYGGKPKVAGLVVDRPMLHAYSLGINHPITQKPLFFQAAVPKDFAQAVKQAKLIGKLADLSW